MARTRLIKPGFFTNDELVECSAFARLVFAGLWTIADREGRLEDRPKRIKAELLPYDTIDVDGLLDELSGRGFIQRYAVGSGKYIQVVNFTKHQSPHFKEPASSIPPPSGWEDSGVTPGAVPTSVRQEVMERDQWKCVRCGAGDRLSIDHIVPRTKGGSNAIENLRVLCTRCNSAKGNRDASAINEPYMPQIIGMNGASSTPDPDPVSDPDPVTSEVPCKDGTGSVEPRVRHKPIDESFIADLQAKHPSVNVMDVYQRVQNRKTWDGYKDKRRALRDHIGYELERQRNNGRSKHSEPDEDDPIVRRLRLDAEREGRTGSLPGVS